ncbi:ABC transporter permease [Candidatus Dependentiae bacterium]
MNELLLVRVALRSLMHHKGRSVLTMLGIIIGIAAIIATMAIGKGAQAKIKSRISAMGENYVHIIPGNPFSIGKVKDATLQKYKHLRERDVAALEKQLDKIEHATPFLHVREVVTFGHNNVKGEIKGGDEHLLKILNRTILKGASFNRQHVVKGSRVAVLGKKMAENLFGAQPPLGQKIRVKKTLFTVIGVIDEIKDYFGINDPNIDIYLPVTALRQHILSRKSPSIAPVPRQKRRYIKNNGDTIHGIALSAKNKEDIPTVIRQITRIMRARHKLKENEQDDFTIFDQQSMSQAADDAVRILQILLMIIASISLLVGGVGVMNIMLVSVTERTKEIGIRMAIGATEGLILRQFLYEAMVLCLTGGIFGIVIGVTVPEIAGRMTGWQPQVTIISVVSAFLITTAVGVFFGFYPARKASKLNPVVALEDR